MNLERVLALVRAGDIATLDAEAAGGEYETATAAEKNLLTREAASAGQAAMLRHLFEYHHLYETDDDAQGRTLLHYAATSGDAETVRFAVEVLGYDPMEGDSQGRTALDYAGEAKHQEAYDWMTRMLGFGLEDCYRNPILRGFHPDPAILRVGEDYYMVNSSFFYLPALPISHSRDLVHWEVIGHALEDLDASRLSGLPGGYGYWAPDISYYHGKFWVVATLRRNTEPYRLQMITSAERPEGPWAPPKFLPLDGIDPSLFADDDGRRYILLNPGAILAEINEEGDLISGPEMIFYGTLRIKPEGPHLLKKDGWYYLFLAEGGTGCDHAETVLRSKNLRGPYESCPFNPILGRKKKNAAIQRSGHGKPMMLPDGRWAMAYLCGRYVEGKTLLGRETALDPIVWTEDGWPMVNRLRGPSCLQRKLLPDAPLGEGRNKTWIAPRNDPRAFAQFRGEEILLHGGDHPANISPCSVLLRRQTEPVFSQQVHVRLQGTSEGCIAGLMGYYDERSFFLFGIRQEQDGWALILAEQVDQKSTLRTLKPLPAPEAVLKVTGDGLNRTLIHAGEKICTFRAEYLSDEGVEGGKRFTGALIGLGAIGKCTASFTAYEDQMLDQREGLSR